MASWLSKRSKRAPSTRSRNRRTNPNQVINRVGLSELTPDLTKFLGHAAYVQLSFFECLSQAVVAAPSTASKEAVSRAAGDALARHQGFVAELTKLGKEPSAMMEPFVAATDAFQLRVRGSDWSEALLAHYVVAGILDDGFVSMAEGFDRDIADRVSKLLSDERPSKIIVKELSAAIKDNPRLASRLALYGRRLVGDVLLLARTVLDIPQGTASGDERLEPVVTELIANHTRRMDNLGLTA